MYSSQNKVVTFTHNNLLGCGLRLTYAQYHLTFYWIPHKLLPNIVVLQRKVNWSLDYNKENKKERGGTEANFPGAHEKPRWGEPWGRRTRPVQSLTSSPSAPPTGPLLQDQPVQTAAAYLWDTQHYQLLSVNGTEKVREMEEDGELMGGGFWAGTRQCIMAPYITEHKRPLPLT